MEASATGAPLNSYAQIEANSARTFTLVGLVFYIIAAAIGGIVVVATALAFIFFVPPPVTPPFPGSTVFFGLLFPVVFLGVGIGLTVWTWMTLQHIEAGRYQQAQAPTLILGILGLFFAFLIGGIFLIVAYTKLGNVVGPQPAPAPLAAPVAAPAAAPAGGRMCPNCGRPIPMEAKFCNHCGQELP